MDVGIRVYFQEDDTLEPTTANFIENICFLSNKPLFQFQILKRSKVTAIPSSGWEGPVT